MSTDEFFISERITRYKEEEITPHEQAFYGFSGEHAEVKQSLGRQYIEALDRFLAYLYELPNAPGSRLAVPSETDEKMLQGIEVQIAWAEAEKIKVADLTNKENDKIGASEAARKTARTE